MWCVWVGLGWFAGKFAISYVANRVVHHSKIVNDWQHGFHFEASQAQKDIRSVPPLPRSLPLPLPSAAARASARVVK